MKVAAKTVGALALITAALPANLALTATALLVSSMRRAPTATASQPRTVLISGGKMTKALALCRAFHRAGHRVVLVESAKYRLTGHRFSNCVDAFHVVPSPNDPGYADALLDVVRAEGVDVYVPVCSPVASWYDAKAAETLAPYCEVLHADADTVAMLDDKHAFVETAAGLGLPVPASHRITRADQVADAVDDRDAPYVLKNLAYDPVNRLDLTLLPRTTRAQTLAFASSKSISDVSPWAVQSFVRGQEFCTHSTVRDGRLLVFTCCESSAFQVNYAMVEHPGIKAWVRSFVHELGLTGQVSFDFIVDEHDGQVRAIECNPRTHSAITMFYDHPGLAAAYLGDPDADGGGEPLEPRPTARPTYWMYHEVWDALRSPRGAGGRLATIVHGKDAIFDLHDPLPFLLVHHLQIPSLLLRNLIRGKDWTRVDFNIGKLVEPGGD